MQAIIDREHGGFALGAADWAFYTEKVRADRYAFDAAQLRPYFELNHVLIDGVFFAATRFYGITFKERHDLPLYRPDVRAFEVFDRDGSDAMRWFLMASPILRGGNLIVTEQGIREAVRQVLLPHSQRRPNPFFEEGLVWLNPVR